MSNSTFDFVLNSTHQSWLNASSYNNIFALKRINFSLF